MVLDDRFWSIAQARAACRSSPAPCPVARRSPALHCLDCSLPPSSLSRIPPARALTGARIVRRLGRPCRTSARRVGAAPIGPAQAHRTSRPRVESVHSLRRCTGHAGSRLGGRPRGSRIDRRRARRRRPRRRLRSRGGRPRRPHRRATARPASPRLIGSAAFAPPSRSSRFGPARRRCARSCPAAASRTRFVMTRRMRHPAPCALAAVGRDRRPSLRTSRRRLVRLGRLPRQHAMADPRHSRPRPVARCSSSSTTTSGRTG